VDLRGELPNKKERRRGKKKIGRETLYEAPLLATGWPALKLGGREFRT